MTSFVSASAIKAAKELRKSQKRESREEVLREAKESFERDKRLQELKRQRGEDTWIAPSVGERLGFRREEEEGEPPERKKKKRHKKEHKKHKKHKGKKTRDRNENTSSSESEEGEGMWVEQGGEGKTEFKVPLKPSGDDNVAMATTSAAESAPLKRDDWMTLPLAPSALSMARLAERDAEQRREEEQKKSSKQLQCFDKPGQHPRELNPYWRDGGSGMPQGKLETHSAETEDRPRSSQTRIGDGGRSWIQRAYKRAIEQAETKGESLEQIATKRWGSLEKLHSLLRAAGIDPQNPDCPPRSGRRDYLYSDPHHRDSRRRDDYSRSRDRDRDRGRGSRRERNSNESRRREDSDDSQNSASCTGGFLKPGKSDSTGGSDPNRFAGVGPAHMASTSSQGWRRKKTSREVDAKVDLPSDRNTVSESARGSSRDLELSPPRSSREEKKAEETQVLQSMELSARSLKEEKKAEETQVLPSAELVTDSKLNAMGAKLMKAELMGDAEKIEKLKHELERLRRMKELQEQQSSGEKRESVEGKRGREEKTVVLTKTDRFGRTKPLEFVSNRPGPSRTPTHTKKGKREKYFADDDRYSLKALVEQERMTTAEETHAAIARMAAKFVPASNADETVDDVFDSKAVMRSNPAKEEERQRQKAILESRKMTDVLENCTFCFDNPNFHKHLLIAVGINTYLAAPAHQSLTEGHCFIVPMEHVMCSMALDENVWSEMKVFQKGLTHMFAEHNMDTVFMETYTSIKRVSHMYIECIPMPKEEGELAPMYFKKAILESDEEWADNKKLVDTKRKGVRSSIPAGLPYFFVDFGLDGGYAHIIENQSKFPHYFGREVVGGMLDVEPRLWLKPPKDHFERQKEKVLQLCEWWKPFDWTQKLGQS